METVDSNEEQALTEEQLVKYAKLNPFIIYSDGGRLSVAILEGVKSSPNPLKIRKQGVRKGVLGYNAKATVSTGKLVPVFALVQESLIDSMLISPAALALGMAAITQGSNTNPDLVDMLVEEYEESVVVEREFFPAQEDASVGTDGLTAIGVHTTTEPTFTGQYVMPSDYGVMEPAYIGQSSGPGIVAADLTTAEWSGETVATYTAEVADVLTSTACGTITVGSADAMVVPLEPGILADGELLDFDPEVHVIPQ